MNLLGLEASLQVRILKMLSKPPKEPRMTKLAPIINALFPSVTKAIQDSFADSRIASEWTQSAEEALFALGILDIGAIVRRDIIQGAVIYYFLNEINNEEALKECCARGGIR